MRSGRSPLTAAGHNETDHRQDRYTNITDKTKSNKTKVVRTPGGKLVAQHIKKRASVAKCGDTGAQLAGVRTVRPRKYASLKKSDKSVTRAYGGSLSANAVRERIIRAFLIEEQKIVKKVLKDQEKK